MTQPKHYPFVHRYGLIAALWELNAPTITDFTKTFSDGNTRYSGELSQIFETGADSPTLITATYEASPNPTMPIGWAEGSVSSPGVPTGEITSVLEIGETSTTIQNRPMHRNINTNYGISVRAAFSGGAYETAGSAFIAFGVEVTWNWTPGTGGAQSSSRPDARVTNVRTPPTIWHRGSNLHSAYSFDFTSITPDLRTNTLGGPGFVPAALVTYYTNMRDTLLTEVQAYDPIGIWRVGATPYAFDPTITNENRIRTGGAYLF